MFKEEKKNRVKNAGLEKLFDFLGELLAFLTIALYAVLIVDASFHFIPEGTVMDILLICRTYASLALIIVVGLEAVVKRSFLVRLVFYILVAIVIIFQFFPGTWEQLLGYVGK